MQTWRREGLLTNQGLSWAQRLSYLATMLTYFEGWQRLVLFFSPAIVLLTGLMPIAAVDFDFLVRFVPYFLLNYWVFEEVGRGYARTVLTEQYTMSRFAVFIAATFGLFLKKLRFVVTPKAMGETDATRRTLWPQYLVLVLNALAIPAGVVLYLGTGHLPAGALVANILWAALTAWLAFLAIAHAMRVARFRRREYRFPVPIPFQITAHDDDSVILVTDVSPAGCKLSGPDVHELRYGEVVRGALILPDAEVRVQAVVRSRTAASGQATGNSVGCEFVWNTPEDQAQLEILLYGSDLQWQFNGLREKARTPMERATGFFKRANHRSPDIASESWAPLLLSSSHVGSSQRVAYISPPDGRSGQRRLAALDSHPDGTTISGMEVTAAGARPINGRLAAFDVAEFATSPVHLYRWTK
jgi:cellulose synthase (UDP-forming)